jgi:putative ABC transport system permease protein
MLKNYLLIALRSFLQYRLYSSINVLGLAAGLASCVLIGLFVQHELSYDRQYANADRVYRASRVWYADDGAPAVQLATIAPQAAALLEEDFPQVMQSARMFRGGQPIASDALVSYEHDYWVDAEFLELFDFDWVQGDARTALAAPNSVVLTESLATKYFGNANALDGTLSAGGVTLRVTGIIRDLPNATHFDFTMLGSLSTLGDIADAWSNNFYYTYLLLDTAAAADLIQQQSSEFMERHAADPGAATGFELVALTDIHLHSDRGGEMGTPGSLASVLAFSAIAGSILLIACFNFMNLSTARAAARAKEVGLRKSIGAARAQLIAQFLGESLLLVLLAIALALAVVELALPVFGALMGTELDLPSLASPGVLAVLASVLLGVGLLAGSYPAFYLSSFRSAQVLKGDMTRGRGATVFREVLVVFQFAITITLLIATAVVYLQTNLANNVDTGYDKEQVVVLDLPAGVGTQWRTLRNQLLLHPQIISAAASSTTPASALAGGSSTTTRHEPGGPDAEQSLPFIGVEDGFFETYDIAVLAGRTFSADVGTDRMTAITNASPQASAGFVLSELAARQLGWTPEQALGKWFEMSLGNRFGRSARGPVVGVVANVNFKSVRSALEPLFYYIPPEDSARLTQASLEIAGVDVQDTLDYVARVWKEFMPGQPLGQRFVEQDFAALYADQVRQARLFTSLTLLAISVACLGLLGLASYATERRVREIAVRKILGGSAWNIVLMFTGNFSRLVLMANVVAWPVAYFTMERWLENFAYRIDLTPLIFIGSGLIALCIAWVTVGGTAAKAATQKPVLALRYE